jgi:hypothetical protein
MRSTAIFGVTTGALLASAPAAKATPDRAPDVIEPAAGSSYAPPPPVEHAGPSGFELGVRLGYSRPMGGIAQGASLSDIVSNRFPLWFDVGYRVNPNWYFGAFLEYGIMSVPSSYCTTCSAHDITGGIGAMYHVAPDAFIDPWLGIGMGYESVSGSEGFTGNSISFSGFQFCNLQAGADYYLHHLAIGPFASLSVAQYSSATLTVLASGSGGTGTGSTVSDIKGQALHEWLTIGLRATYDIFPPQ